MLANLGLLLGRHRDQRNEGVACAEVYPMVTQPFHENSKSNEENDKPDGHHRHFRMGMRLPANEALALTEHAHH